MKYADGTKNEWTAVWDANNPKPIFDLRPDEEDDDKAREENRLKKSARERSERSGREQS